MTIVTFDGQTVWKYRSPIYYASFETFEEKIVWLFRSESVLKVSSEFDFWEKYIALKFIKIIFLKEIHALIVEHIIDYFLLSKCQRKCYELVYNFLKKFAGKKLSYK